MKPEGFDIRTIRPVGAYSASRYRLARIRVDECAKKEQHFVLFFGQDPQPVCIRFGERSCIISLALRAMARYHIQKMHVYDVGRDEMIVITKNKEAVL